MRTDIPTTGARLLATVQHATEFRCILLVDGMRARLMAPTHHPWSKYRVLYEAGYLEPGRILEVVAGKWEPRLKTLRVTLPQGSGEPGHRHLEGKVILLRPRYIKAHKKSLQNVIYVEITPGEIVRIESSDLKRVEDAFPLGSRIPVVVGEPDRFSFMPNAEIDWNKTAFSTPREFAVGTSVEAPVIRLAPYGATCLLDDRVSGFVHRNSILGANSEQENLIGHLHLGDMIRVRVVEEKDEKYGAYRLEYLGGAAPSSDEVPIDTDVERVTQISEKRPRDKNFSWTVIEAYKGTCCICGNRFLIGDSGAVQAAHVVPHADGGREALENGLCLCLVHHWAFDAGLLAIDDKLVVHVANFVRELGDEGAWLAQFHGRDAFLGSGEFVNRAALKWHMQNVFIDEAEGSEIVGANARRAGR